MRGFPAPLCSAAFAALLGGCPGSGVGGPEPPVEVASTMPLAAPDATGADYPTPTSAAGSPTGIAPSFELPDASAPPPLPPAQPFPTMTGAPPAAPSDPLLAPPPVDPTPEGTTL